VGWVGAGWTLELLKVPDLEVDQILGRRMGSS
jgi:hypothetical protein